MASREPQWAWVCCRLCAEAHLLRGPTEPWLPKEEEYQQAVVKFLETHAQHPVTQLVPTPAGRSVYSGPLWDPSTVALIEVTDGREVYVLETFRSDVGEPRRYRVRIGRLPEVSALLTLDTALALRAVEAEFGNAVSPVVARQLVAVAVDALKRISPATIDPAFDDPNDPDLTFGDWPDEAVETLVTTGTQLLPPELHERWQMFLHEQCRASGAWAVQLRALRGRASATASLPAPL